MSLFGSKTTEPPTKGCLEMNKRCITISQCGRIIQPLDELVDELVPGLPGILFLNSLGANSNFRVISIPPVTLDEDSATLGAYHGLNALSTAQEIHDLLEKSWVESPDLTLRIIWNMRSIHEGQSDRIGFYRAFGWLYKHHPRTALKNLKLLVEGSCTRKVVHKLKIDFSKIKVEPSQSRRSRTKPPIPRETEEIEIKLPHGYYKDLLNILVLAMEDELTDPSLAKFKSLNVPHDQYLKRSLAEFKSIKETKAKENERLGTTKAKEMRRLASLKKDATRSTTAKEARHAKYNSNLTALNHKLDNDNRFLALYATVAHIFADQLAKDIELLRVIESAPSKEAFMLKFGLSNSSKWAPTLEGFHDRTTNISTAIALVLFSRGLMPGIPVEASPELGQEKAHIIRSYYRRWFLTPLRRFIEVTEVKMSERQWYSIDSSRVPSRCLLNNKEIFWNRGAIMTKNHFNSTPGVGGTTLKPHELLGAALKLDYDTECALKALPPLRCEPPPPMFEFATPFGKLKLTEAKASLMANQIGALVDYHEHRIYFSTPNIPPQLAKSTRVQTSSSAVRSTTTTVPSHKAIPFVRIGATQASTLPNYKIEYTKDGHKYLVCGRFRFEVERPETPASHQILIGEVNDRNPHAGQSNRNRKLTEASKEVEKKREIILNKHSTLKNFIESQWGALIEQLGGPDTLASSLAIVDFNKSMRFPLDSNWYKLTPKRRKPMPPFLPAMALGTLLSKLSKAPFKDIILVSKEDPQLIELPDKGLFQAAKYIDSGVESKQRPGRDSDSNEAGYEAVFLKLLLPTAINHKTKPKDMVKQYFIFSDLKFGSSIAKETHARIARAFRREEYPVPNIAYWNLHGEKIFPAHEDASGCAMVTGLSSNPLRQFVSEGEASVTASKRWTPHEAMNVALRKPCYDTLKLELQYLKKEEAGEERAWAISNREKRKKERLELGEADLGEGEEGTKGGGVVRVGGKGRAEDVGEAKEQIIER
ncbi:hypothetical protein FRC09_006277 [Ceratobasidium sp. 395]|nr:hypothetical protein FRC09_006277 [Ceratobasidium sp. 395]